VIAPCCPPLAEKQTGTCASLSADLGSGVCIREATIEATADDPKRQNLTAYLRCAEEEGWLIGTPRPEVTTCEHMPSRKSRAGKRRRRRHG